MLVEMFQARLAFRGGFTSIAKPGHKDELISAGGFWIPDES
jgi:hypothetical protein